MADINNIGVRSTGNASSAVLQNIIMKDNIRKNKQTNAQLQELYKLVTNYASNIETKTKVRLIVEYGDGSRINKNSSEDEINRVYADVLISNLPPEELNRLVRQIHVDSQNLAKEVRTIQASTPNRSLITKFNGNEMIFNGRGYAYGKARLKYGPVRSAITAIWSRFHDKYGTRQLRKEVEDILKDLNPIYLYTLAASLGIEAGDFSVKALIKEITTRTCYFYDVYISGKKVKKLYIHIDINSITVYKAILSKTSFGIKTSGKDEENMKAFVSQYLGIDSSKHGSSEYKARMKINKELAKEKKKINKSKLLNVPDEIQALYVLAMKNAETDPDIRRNFNSLFGFENNPTKQKQTLATIYGRVKDMAENLDSTSSNYNTSIQLIDRFRRATGIDILNQDTIDEETSNTKEIIESTSTTVSTQESQPSAPVNNISSLAIPKFIPTMDPEIRYKTDEVKQRRPITDESLSKFNFHIYDPAVTPVAVVNGVNLSLTSLGNLKNNLTAPVLDILSTTTDGVANIVDNTSYMNSLLPKLWTTLSNFFPAAAVVSGESIAKGIADELADSAYRKFVESVFGDVNRKAITAADLDLVKFATGGRGSAISNITNNNVSNIITGDSLTSKPNPEVVSIDWSNKNFSVKPMNSSENNSNVSNVKRMGSAERMSAMSVTLSNAMIEYSKNIPNSKNNDSLALKTYVVNPWLNEKMDVNGTEISVMELLYAMYTYLDSINNNISAGNSIMTAGVAALSKPVVAPEQDNNPYMSSGFTDKFDNILRGV